MTGEEQERVSKYNSGVMIIQRLHDLWLDTHNHSRNGQFSKWNNDLDRIWLELARDLPKERLESKENSKGERIKGKKEEFEEFDKELSKEGELGNSSFQGFENPNSEKVKKRNNQYKLLMDKEFFLRRLENEIGKGTKWQDTSDDDMD